MRGSCRLDGVKRAVLLFLSVILVSIALFPKEILLKGMIWQTARYCKEAFGAEFNFETIAWKAGKIVLKGGTICRNEDFCLSFAEAELLPSLNLKNRTFGGKLCVKGAKVVHRKYDAFLLPSRPSSSFNLLNFHLETKVEAGELFLCDLSRVGGCLHSCRFDLSHEIEGKVMRGSAAVHMPAHNDPICVHFCYEQNELEITAEFHNASCPLFASLASYFIDRIPAPFFQWDIKQGSASGHLKLVATQGMPHLLAGRVHLEQLSAENASLKLVACIDQLAGDLDLDFCDINSASCAFELKQGSIFLQENITIFDEMLDLANVYATMCIEGGKVKSSQLKGQFLGMEGNMSLDSASQDNLLNMSFGGSSRMVKTFLPLKLRKKFETAFAEDAFSLHAGVVRKAKGLELVGELKIDAPSGASHQLDFGCKLAAQPERIEMEAIVPENFSLSRSIDSFLANIKTQFCLSHKRFGWFQGKQFPLDKFLSPFLFPGEEMKLSGLADFRATFDERFLVIFYEGREFLLDSPNFSVRVDSVKESLFNNSAAAHYFDLSTWAHVGFLPIKKGSYSQKNYDFHLESVNALIHFENGEIHIRDIVTEIDGIDLEGEVDLVGSSKQMELFICADKMKGPFEKAHSFLSKFIKLLPLPFHGKVVGAKKCIQLHYSCVPQPILLEAKVDGHVLLHGSCPLGSIENYTAGFSFDYGKNSLDITEGRGQLVLKGISSALAFETPIFSISDLKSPIFDFSCSVFKKGVPWLELGSSSTRLEGEVHYLFTIQADMFNGPVEIAVVRKGSDLYWTQKGKSPWASELTGTIRDNKIFVEKLSVAKDQTLSLCFNGEWDLNSKRVKGRLYDVAAKMALPISSCTIDCDLNPLRLAIFPEDGFISCFEERIDLKDCYFLLNSENLNFKGKVIHEDQSYWLYAVTHGFELNRGKIALLDGEAVGDPFDEGIVATWSKKPSGQFTIEKIEGALSGVAAQLVLHDPDQTLSLKGELHVAAEKLHRFLPEKWQGPLEKCALSGGFTASGHFLADGKSACFSGKLSGYDYRIKGISLHTFSADVELSSERVELKQLSIRDWAGRLFLNQAILVKEADKKWHFYIDDLTVNDLRVSRVRSSWTKWKSGKRPFFSSLFLPSCELKNIEGEMARPETIRGCGTIEFTNLPRKTFFSSLLFLPTEINARIGLDFSTLIPVRGCLDYEIKDNRVCFTKFKEMYSDGKRSRFYLASGSEAFVDFAGNVDLKIKMKQYTLLMKLAELFTISIQGKLPNLSYTFRNPANL